ncbi:hypothetical protein [Anseongella ginsenosidimutans]|nr:hypothetical protein [Anseongella ginsenosidimutans]QEC52473.1 hypothetical protein FRZ59_09080 [Anseongella ginsenosidimutans]
MRRILYAFCIAAVSGALLTACNNAPEKTAASREQPQVVQDQEALAHIRLTYQPGDYVPTEFVCMMTDEYREMRQRLVLFEGRAYFGCCEKCQELLTKNASMRTAIDPFTSKPVDKATAYIVLTGNNDKVMYFASEENYRRFAENRGD